MVFSIHITSSDFYRTVKGAVLGVHDLTPNSTPEETARVDLQIILQTQLVDKAVPLHVPAPKMTNYPHLRTYAQTAQIPTWSHILESFKRTTDELRGARLLRMLSRGNIFNGMRVANQGIIWRDLSIDLVAAALRQREFARKITSAENAEIDTPPALSRAISRYHKFVLLMNRKNSKKVMKVALVPTLDIDLCWHTHQLSGASYREWCIEHLGVAINHDDTVGKESLDDGLKETTKAWYEAYREPYASNEERPRSRSIIAMFRTKKDKGMHSDDIVFTDGRI